MKCKKCRKTFKETDEIVRSTLNGEVFLHIDCHYEYLLQCDSHEYLTYAEAIGEFEEE